VGTVRVIVLGSSSGGPSRDNPASGYLVETAGARIWLDAGPGTFMALAEHIDPGTLDAVVISHTHVDHCSDLLALFAHLAYGSGPGPRVTVHAPEGTRDHIAAFARAGEGHVLHDTLSFDEVTAGSRRDVGDVSLAFGHAVHPVPALVSRLTSGGASLVYSGDTGPGGDLLEIARSAGTLLCEATLTGVRDASTYPYHLTAWEAGDIAASAGVHDLILTHLPRDSDPVRSIDEAGGAFVGDIRYAEPGSTFMVEETE